MLRNANRHTSTNVRTRTFSLVAGLLLHPQSLTPLAAMLCRWSHSLSLLCTITTGHCTVRPHWPLLPCAVHYTTHAHMRYNAPSQRSLHWIISSFSPVQCSTVQYIKSVTTVTWTAWDTSVSLVQDIQGVTMVTWTACDLTPACLQPFTSAVEATKGGGGVVAEPLSGLLPHTTRHWTLLPLWPRRPPPVHCNSQHTWCTRSRENL